MNSSIIAIAQREADRAAHQAQKPEDAAVVYFETVTKTRERGYKAEEILAAGGVSPNGKAGKYDVKSQNGGGTYTVDLEARTCDCPDHTNRGTYCKHLQAAELYQDTQDPLTEADGQQVILEAEGYARGRQLLNKRLVRVRVNGGAYREAKTQNFYDALAWLMGEGYELAEQTNPETTMGRAKVRYTYRKAQGPETHHDALPYQTPNRRRDRLFKGAN